MVDCLAYLGRHEEARALYERLLQRSNDVGLFGEEIDQLPATSHERPVTRYAFTLNAVSWNPKQKE
jgi:pentatricopeptide repeat protein